MIEPPLQRRENVHPDSLSSTIPQITLLNILSRFLAGIRLRLLFSPYFLTTPLPLVTRPSYAPIFSLTLTRSSPILLLTATCIRLNTPDQLRLRFLQ